MVTSNTLFADAQSVLVGGVNSPVRAYKAVGRDPIFIESGKGPYVTSVEGKRYCDYVLSYGPLLAGHAHDMVIADIHNAIIKGTSFGAPTRHETALAKRIQSMMPAMQTIRFVNSGTEATMSAIRLARGATNRSHLVKFEGGYHGHVDSLLVSAGSGGLTLGTPSSAGIPHEVTAFTHVIPFNDTAALTTCFDQYGAQIAALIMEPVCGNMGVVLPDPEFLHACRRITSDHGSLLIFDEVMTGFRVHKNGAQGHYGIAPDITCLGKVIGGGLPCAAYGGSTALMHHVSPLGPVYQAGTLSGNPLAMRAGLAMMSLIADYGVYETAERQTHRLVAGIQHLCQANNVAMQVNALGTMFTVFFSATPVRSLTDVNNSNTDLFKAYFNYMVDHGILIPPSPYEANFVSSEHNDAVIDDTLAVIQGFIRDHHNQLRL
jgi:glutamate-1-semialdehyde 2,1-aminomutase